MADFLQTGSTWLQAQRKAHLAHTVTYRRGDDSVSLAATVGRTEFEVINDVGSMRWESRDFIVTAADLTLGRPRRGDRIVETLAGNVATYEVLAPPGEPEWRWSDEQTRLAYRIHTKLVKET